MDLHGRASARPEFALFVGQVEEAGAAHPFEVWVNGAEQPRGLGALAKAESTGCARSRVARHKLDALANASSTTSLRAADAAARRVTARAQRGRGLGALCALALRTARRIRRTSTATPVLDALFTREEPRTGPDGTMTWTVDVANPATGDDFVLGLKELQMLHDGRRSAALLDLARGRISEGARRPVQALSLDMRVIDPAWIGMKLRKLLTYAEPLGDFFAPIPEPLPDGAKQRVYPSTVAYVATLVLHRFATLGILDVDGFPTAPMGLVSDPIARDVRNAIAQPAFVRGRRCEECGSRALIRVDGCDRCTVCGAIGVCG